PAQEQLTAFRLQTACAREARAWLNERERNEGYNPNANGNLSIVVDLGRTHYSLARRACYAVIDQQTTLSGKFYNFNYSRQLYQVDGDLAVAQISGDTIDVAKTFVDPAGVLVRDLKACSVGETRCDSLATWNLWTRSYLEE
ncbi:MAG TPA: hypothetical protein VFN79_06360, partial [Steroidobacteraceae bacterium]|nr:hypothetical protein [Steroidobacteraceae bacterium]